MRQKLINAVILNSFELCDYLGKVKLHNHYMYRDSEIKNGGENWLKAPDYSVP